MAKIDGVEESVSANVAGGQTYPEIPADLHAYLLGQADIDWEGFTLRERKAVDKFLADFILYQQNKG